MTGSRAGDADVDARFLLANERTLLAWTRTALTLMAGGVGLQLADVGRGLPALLVLVGVAAQAAGTVRYRRADLALRRGELPPAGVSVPLLSAAVVLVGVVVAALLASGDAG